MKKLSNNELEFVRKKFCSPYLPEMPDEYLDWLVTFGSGKHESGYEIYSEPINSADIFGEMSQRSTGYFVVIGTKGWDAWIGYRYLVDEGKWELVFHDAYDFGVDLIPEGLEQFLKINK